MKSSFVRAIWGNCINKEYRNGKVDKDIQRVLESEFEPEFTTYVFGIDNYRYFKNELGMKRLVLVDSKSTLWDLETEMYRHKLEVFKCAMSMNDEIVYLDWDCVATKSIPDNFWEEIRKKDSFQANLFQYRTKKCIWRETDPRKVTNGGFIYIGNKSIPQKFIENWDSFKERNEKIKSKRSLKFREQCLTFDDEPAMSKYVDDCMGGWKGMEEYWEKFEPEFCNLRKKSAFEQSQLESKDACFIHML